MSPITEPVVIVLGGQERHLLLTANGLLVAEKHLDPPGTSLLTGAGALLRKLTVGTVRALLYGALMHETPGKTLAEKQAALPIDEVGDWITFANVNEVSVAVVRCWRVSQGLTPDLTAEELAAAEPAAGEETLPLETSQLG